MSDAAARRKLLKALLERRVLAYALSGVGALYFAAHLFVFVRLAGVADFLAIVVALFICTLIRRDVLGRASSEFSRGSSTAIGRLVVVVVAAFPVAVGLAVAKLVAFPDGRIREPFDPDIPLYVIEDVSASPLYLQHILRLGRFLELNVESLALMDLSILADLVRFIVLLEPAPLIALVLLTFGVESLSRQGEIRRPEVER